MSEKDKALELVGKFDFRWDITPEERKQCALISVENEYKSNRELLFNLRSCGMIQNEKVYLARLQNLIDEEEQVKQEINNL